MIAFSDHPFFLRFRTAGFLMVLSDPDDFVSMLGVTKRYAGVTALDNVDFRVSAGEAVCLTGENGSGKSTLSNVIAGKPGYLVNDGKILLDGENILDKEPEDRASMGVYMAFQYPVEIPGIANASFLRTALNAIRKHNGKKPINTRDFLDECKNTANNLGLDKTFLSRDLIESLIFLELGVIVLFLLNLFSYFSNALSPFFFISSIIDFTVEETEEEV